MTSALPQEAAMSLGPVAGIMGRMGGLMFGAQIGQALGKLADEVVTSTDVGLHRPAGTGVLVPQNVDDFAAGLEPSRRRGPAVPRPARGRLAAAVRARPWLRQQLQDAVHAYARGITIDREAIERGITEAMSGMEGGLDPSNPESIQQLLGGVLEPEETPSSRWRCAAWRRCSRSWRAGSTRSSPRRRRTGCRATPRSPRPCAGAGPRADRRSRRSPRWSASSCARAGSATPRPCGAP